MSDTLLTALIAIVLTGAVLLPYIRKVRRKEREARERFHQASIAGLQEAVSVHPHIDILQCIGCGGCVGACPEGDVLALIGGRATLVHGAKCVGHGLCAEACPVGAITLLTAPPSRSADLPMLSDRYETSVQNLYIAGELGGIGLIRNAITQGKGAMMEVAARRERPPEGGYDVLIVGAGPAGLAAALTAKEQGLRYVLLEQGDIGGTILQYPRRKIVLTSPVELPVWGKLTFTEMEKEKLLALWQNIIRETELNVRVQERVTDIQREGASFQVTTICGTYRAAAVILALGRRGTPRKLGVPGEELGKVTYRLTDTAGYQGAHILAVGGGDSAVEAAVGLSIQRGNTVTLSYRRAEFQRIKQRNREHLEDAVKRGAVRLATPSTVAVITPETVVLQTGRGDETLRNDFVFIFAGGEMPFELLRRCGVDFRVTAVS